MYEIAALTLPIVNGNSQVIIPSGVFNATKGSLKGQGPWTLNDKDGLALIDRANSGIDIVIDYGHQTLLAPENGKPAPAAGWIIAGSLTWIPDVGVVANEIKWTIEAAEMIREGEYRFLSPVFSYGKDGIPIDLMSVGITNTPALTTLQELAIAANNRGSNMSDEIKETQPVQVVTPVASVAPIVETKVVAPVIQEVQVAAASQLDSNPMVALLTSQLISAREEAVQARAKLASLEKQLADGTKQAMITAALSEGKLVSGMVVWASNLSMGDLKDYLDKSAPIAALSGMQTQNIAPAPVAKKADVLNESEIAVCSQLGITHEKFLAQKSKLSEVA